MNEVKVLRVDLLAKLLENRKRHEEEYMAAYDTWVDAMIAQLKKNLAHLKKHREPRGHLRLPQPLSYVKQYDQATAMLEMSVEDEIVLSSNEFNQYVLDNWNWKQMFSTVNSTYLAGKLNAV